MGKIGFCFNGEGARGAIQAGIALALHNQGIDADFVIGTSSGSCCASLYSYAGPALAAEMWGSVKSIFSVFGVNWNFLWNTGFFNQKPAEKLITKYVTGKPQCEGVVLRMNIESGDLEYINNQNISAADFAEATLCAFAITGFVSDRNGWVDAGSREMTPLRQCIDAGCDDIYVILGRPFAMSTWQKPKGLLKIAGMAFRALDISLMELMLRDINSCLQENGHIQVHLVEPRVELYNSILFRKCAEGVAYGMNTDNFIDTHTMALQALMTKSSLLLAQ